MDKKLIILKTEAEIELIKKAGSVAHQMLKEIELQLRPGMSTDDIDLMAQKMAKKFQVINAPFNYKGFPKSICTSINDVVCHGIPSKKHVLREGDIINVDVTPILNGYHGDTSKTFKIGKVSQKASKLIECSERCLYIGIEAVRVGGHFGDIGEAIENYANSQGFSAVRDFVGHGIGRSFHEDPHVYHYARKNKGQKFMPGMVFTIEPMINEGTFETRTLNDGWTAVTVDGKLSAQFEHTVAIRLDGRVEILTQGF